MDGWYWPNLQCGRTLRSLQPINKITLGIDYLAEKLYRQLGIFWCNYYLHSTTECMAEEPFSCKYLLCLRGSYQQNLREMVLRVLRL